MRFLIMFFMLLPTLAMCQKVERIESELGNIAILENTGQGSGITLTMTVSPKKGTSLVAESLKLGDVLSIDGIEISVGGARGAYTLTVDGEVHSFTTLKELRRYARDVIRAYLGIK